jgi:hypothetical protein
LNKKRDSIACAYHQLREAIAERIMKFANIIVKKMLVIYGENLQVIKIYYFMKV